MSVAAIFLQKWPEMSRDLTLETSDGVSSASCRGVVRGLNADELVNSFDQDELVFVAAQPDLEAAGFYPLPKFARVIDGSRTYTVQREHDAWAAGSVVFVKARVKG